MSATWWTRRALVVIAIATGVACRSVISDEIPVQNIVMFDKRGRLVDPTKRTSTLGYQAVQATASATQDGVDPGIVAFHDPHFESVVSPGSEDVVLSYEDAVAQHLNVVMAALEKNLCRNRRVTIFVHGGMNTQEQTIERASEWAGIILEDNEGADDSAFPIFVNWKSSLWSSYFTHLFDLRQGSEWGVK